MLRKPRKYPGIVKKQTANILGLGRDTMLNIEKGIGRLSYKN